MIMVAVVASNATCPVIRVHEVEEFRSYAVEELIMVALL